MPQQDLLKKKFDELKKKKKCGFISFITAGDPDFNTSYKILEKLPNSGVDIIELGMPFSDPMADGPVIQKANDRAIKNKMNLKKTFGLIKKFRKKNKITPLVLMGYYNPIHRFGIKNFINQINKNKVDGIIVVDLPPEEDNVAGHPVLVTNKFQESSGYSGNIYDIKGATKDGIVYPSLDPSIFELKYPSIDVEGRVIGDSAGGN